MSRPARSIRPAQLVVIAMLALALLVCGSSPLWAQGGDHPLEADGMQPGHGSFGMFPWGQIDTYSGLLTMSFTDLVLPGNSGLDLVVSRVFNSKSRRWAITVGPKMNLNPSRPNPRVRRVDGGLDTMFETSPASGVYLTTSYWRYTKAGRTLETPDGRIYHFLADGSLSQIADVFGNNIDVTYETGLTRVVQHLGAGQDREVLLVEDDQGRIYQVQYAGRTWTYTWGSDLADLTVTPPVGPVSTFDWVAGAENTWTYLVTTPTGGWVRYNGAPVTRAGHQTSMVVGRQSGGPDIAEGSWSLDYSGTSDYVTTVSGPTRILRHLHRWWDGGGASVGLSQETVFAPEDTGQTSPLETRTFTYRPYPADPQPGSVAPVGLPDPDSGDVPYPLLLHQVETTRGASTTTRRLTYCGEAGQPACPLEPVNDAGLPSQVTETGDGAATREVLSTYRHAFGSHYIRGRVASTTVAVGGDTWSSSAAYTDQGFLASHTELGVTTLFEPDAYGNIGVATDASGHVTSTTYAWGVLLLTTTPEYPITREINADGTVASETRQSQTVSSWYDGLGRVIQVQPRTGWPIFTTYDNDEGRTVTVSRGPTRETATTKTTQTLDGYGRVIHTATAMGVTTDVAYDAGGRAVTASDPYQAPAYPRHDTTTQYDALDRVTQINRPDGSSVTYGYTGLNVTITETVGVGGPHTTEHRRVAGGSPAQAQLVGVRDPAGVWTSYAYTGLGP